MRTFVAAALAPLLFAASAAYADDSMVNFYANTIVSKDNSMPNAAPVNLYFNKDGTYTGKTAGPNGQPVALSGTWSQKDGGKTICIKANLPAGAPAGTPAPKEACGALQMHNVGDSWTYSNDQNQSFAVSLVAGR